jgi:hypothetical protein
MAIVVYYVPLYHLHHHHLFFFVLFYSFKWLIYMLFVAADPEILGSIPGAARFSE